MFILFASHIALAEDGSDNSQSNVAYPRAGNLALGFEITDFQNDYGLGLNLTTPYFFKDTMSVRLHGGIAWFEGVAADEALNDMDSQWIKYFPVRLGWVISVGLGSGLTRLYAEAGGLIYLGAKDIAKDIVVGGYGQFGFEFFPAILSPVSYFFQAGGMGSSGKGTEIMTEPSVGNGFMMEVGFRWYPR